MLDVIQRFGFPVRLLSACIAGTRSHKIVAHMLTLYRRHQKSCSHQREGRKYRRCSCPIWVDGILSGTSIRKSLDTRNWDKASSQIRDWEIEGRVTKEERQQMEISEG